MARIATTGPIGLPVDSRDKYDSDDNRKDRTITSELRHAFDPLYDMVIRGLTSFWVPILTYGAADDRQFPGFAYKSGHEVQDLQEHGLLLDMRNTAGREREMVAPRRDRHGGPDAVRDKDMMDAEHESDKNKEIMHLLTQMNAQLRHETGLRGDESVDPEFIASTKERVHKLLRNRRREVEAASPEVQ